MCGILGGWIEGGVDNTALERGLDAMVHRGPDDDGRHLDGPVFLAMRRLAIIDVAGGHQPMFNEDGSIGVICNGEIYNYRELALRLKNSGHRLATHSDTEILVHLYEDEGEDLCRQLRGMYAFAIWDHRQRCLFLARDRFGKKPIYYARTPSRGLVFASELKALRHLMIAAGGSWSVRNQGIYDYLSLGIVPQPDTIFEGVKAIPPGSWLRFDGQVIEIQKYWTIQYHRKTTISYPQAREAVRELIADAVKLRLRSDVPLGVFLSGGVDSTVVAYEAAKHLGRELRTFTVAVDSTSMDESPIASRTARQLGVRNQILRMRPAPAEILYQLVQQYDQPFADPSAIPSLAISQMAREYVTVVLNGDGGDELFAGYRRHAAAYLDQWTQRVPTGLLAVLGRSAAGVARRRKSAVGLAARLAKCMDLRPGAKYLARSFDMLRESDKAQIWNNEPMRPTEDWLESVLRSELSTLDRQIACEIDVHLVSALLVKMDMATMAFSLEARSPLLDHRLAEFAASLPDRYRIGGFRLKRIIKDAYRDHIPDEVIRGRKRGFEIPLQTWLEGDLQEMVKDTLGSPTARVKTFVESRFIDRLLANETLADRNWAYLVYTFLVLELWLREAENLSGQTVYRRKGGIALQLRNSRVGLACTGSA